VIRGRGGRRHVGAPAPFVVGVGRSGTTLLRLMLDAHPELAIPPETHFIPQLIETAGRNASAADLTRVITGARTWTDFGLEERALADHVAALDRPTAPDVARAFFALYAEGQGKPRWGDKTPIYVTKMRPIGAALPEARFIHLIRDGRDVALSRRKRGMGADKPLADTAQRWRRRIENARKQARRLRGRYLELRFEDLVANAEPALRQVCELIDLAWDDAMLTYYERSGERLRELAGGLDEAGQRQARSGEERLASHALAARPPTQQRTGAWRTEMTPSERAEFEAEAGTLLEQLGYDVGGGSA
jgi:hypothetical protein